MQGFPLTCFVAALKFWLHCKKCRNAHFSMLTFRSFAFVLPVSYSSKHVCCTVVMCANCLFPSSLAFCKDFAVRISLMRLRFLTFRSERHSLHFSFLDERVRSLFSSGKLLNRVRSVTSIIRQPASRLLCSKSGETAHLIEPSNNCGNPYFQINVATLSDPQVLRSMLFIQERALPESAKQPSCVYLSVYFLSFFWCGSRPFCSMPMPLHL